MKTTSGLSLPALHILLALADGDRHGYAIKQDVEARTNGSVRLGPGTLYEAIQRLERQGWIAESPERPDEGRAQRRYYHLTPTGLRALQHEVNRLGSLVDYARSKPQLREP
jgi:DNA-binding PadR family transcriptional regulator